LLRGRDYMISLIDQKIGLRDIAQAASLSPYHFHRAFKHTFRETPHEFLSGQRLKRAAHLLANSEMSITEICLECGFESLPSFSSLFRKSFSMNPSAFRRTHRAN
ncbi:MAG TPA: helix-turn-helix transcriptional regulator, partial [Opitutaceae bacterium]|nr:helix-turn-helix transcriptional regulator [Opitutaceae bacterium]